MKISAEMPRKLGFLMGKRARYKIARGGRGSAKSWSFARALLLLGKARKYRILCAREYQRSIKDSVHKLLCDQIELLRLYGDYKPFETEIRGWNGTEFAFTGLSTLTVDTIKSFEGFDICWVEEGQAVSKRSWDILIPTIRKMDSEIWVSYNPDLETDETHQRFTINQPFDCINVEINWRDNRFFNEVLNKERLYCKKHYPDDYDNIWEGKCRPAVEGAIYYKQIQKAEEDKRICNVPYDPLLKVHVVMDLGYKDLLTAALVQTNASECRIIEYVECNHTSLDDLSAELRLKPYNWGRVWLPHDGYAGKLESGGKSTYDILTKLGWDVVEREEIVELSIEEGIRNARLTFPRVYFDKKRTNSANPPPAKIEGVNTTIYHWNLVECLKRYKRHISKVTGQVGRPITIHGADTFRYICANLDNMENYQPITRFHNAMVVNAAI